MEVWTDGDSLYEIVRWDDANNTLVIRQQSATAGNGAYDYQSFTYESDDQFMTNGDNEQQLPAALKSASAVSLAAFETALKTKMTLASGYALPDTGAGKTGDIYQLVPVNHGANPGVSVIHLGQ